MEYFENRIVQSQIDYYKYLVKIIDQFISGDKIPLQNCIKHLSLLCANKYVIFGGDIQDYNILINGYKNNNYDTLSYLKYKYTLYLNSN